MSPFIYTLYLSQSLKEMTASVMSIVAVTVENFISKKHINSFKEKKKTLKEKRHKTVWIEKARAECSSAHTLNLSTPERGRESS